MDVLDDQLKELEERSSQLEMQMATQGVMLEVLQEETESLRMADGVAESGMHYGYNGPFVGRVAPDGSKVTIGQGYMWAGEVGRYAWPGSGDTDSLSAGGDGARLVLMRFSVDIDNGRFTAVDKPALVLEAAFSTSWKNVRKGPGDVDVILGRMLVSNGVIVQWRQDCYGNISVPVKCVIDSSDEAGFEATWRSEDMQPSVGNIENVTSVSGAAEEEGNVTDVGGPWPWVIP